MTENIIHKSPFLPGLSFFPVFKEQSAAALHLIRPYKIRYPDPCLQITGAERVKIPAEHGKKRLENVGTPFRRGRVFILFYKRIALACRILRTVACGVQLRIKKFFS